MTGRRGRPRGFDLDAATASLEATLWTHGYRGTSVEDLAADAGLSVSSLYAAFGSKQGVLDAALRRYEHEMSTTIAALEQGRYGLRDVDRFLLAVAGVIEAPDSPPGCFMVNTMVEVADTIPEVADRTSSYRQRIESALVAALTRAARAGEIPRTSIGDRARIIQAALFGILISSRAGEHDAARTAISSLRRELRRARLSPAPPR
ncbi:MAG: TetR/AcrR family transcriptional regulator [Acidimicrobiia bacterium]